jgi:hypothetical protein
MRVAIEHKPKTTGFFFKKDTFHAVILTVNFSEEELAIIKLRRLEETTILERECPAHMEDRGGENIYDLRIEHLVKGRPDEYVLATPQDAKLYEEALKDKLTTLKSYIMENKEVEAKTSTFEL